MFRLFNVSLWIYFLPTIALIAQFGIPFYLREYGDKEDDSSIVTPTPAKTGTD